MVSESQSRESLLDSLSHVGWVIQEHHFAQLSSPKCGELWVDHADTSARLNIQKQGTEQWPLMLNLVNVLDPSISDYDGDFGRRLAAAYHEIVARSAIYDSIGRV